MNNPKNIAAQDEELYNRLWQEVRTEKDFAEPQVGSSKKFEVLPDGTYSGRVYIVADTVGNETSPNYGRKKYKFELTVTDGAEKGKMAFFNRILLPHNLSLEPAHTDKEAWQRWRLEASKWIKDTDEMLQACGVMTKGVNAEQLTQNIAGNNRSRPVLNFTMRNGTPKFNYLVRREVETSNVAELFKESLPDGNDLPLV